MKYIGIDPGQSGALAVIDDRAAKDPIIVPFLDVDYVEVLTASAAEDGPFATRCVVESVHAMPKQGVVSSFKFGQNFGWILGVLAALEIPVELVQPQKWKREFGCTADKNTSIAVAKRLFPFSSLRPTLKCRRDNDGMAEALLMAEYCRRHMGSR